MKKSPVGHGSITGHLLSFERIQNGAASGFLRPLAGMNLDLLPPASLPQFADLTIKYGTQTYSVNRQIGSISSGLVRRRPDVSTIDLPDLSSIPGVNAAPNVAADVVSFMFGRKISVSPIPLFILGSVLEIPPLSGLKDVCPPMSPEMAGAVAAACRRVGQDPSFLWPFFESVNISEPLDLLKYLWYPKLWERAVGLKSAPAAKIDELLPNLFDALRTNPQALPVITVFLGRPNSEKWVRRIFEIPGVDLRLAEPMFRNALKARPPVQEMEAPDLWPVMREWGVLADFDPPELQTFFAAAGQATFTHEGEPPTFTITVRTSSIRIASYTIQAVEEWRPKSWRIEGSTDGKMWFVIDERQDSALGTFRLRRPSGFIRKIRFTQLAGTGGKLMKLKSFSAAGALRKQDVLTFE
jgi:hypothetical protein